MPVCQATLGRLPVEKHWTILESAHVSKLPVLWQLFLLAAILALCVKIGDRDKRSSCFFLRQAEQHAATKPYSIKLYHRGRFVHTLTHLPDYKVSSMAYSMKSGSLRSCMFYAILYYKLFLQTLDAKPFAWC